jgi:hypothetical protein
MLAGMDEPVNDDSEAIDAGEFGDMSPQPPFTAGSNVVLPPGIPFKWRSRPEPADEAEKPATELASLVSEAVKQLAAHADSTGTEERAGSQESTSRRERAGHAESTASDEPAVRTESATHGEPPSETLVMEGVVVPRTRNVLAGTPGGPDPYPPEKRRQAKALCMLEGSTTKAYERLQEIWFGERIPSLDTVRRWRQDPNIEPDLDWLKRFSLGVDAAVIGYVDRILGKMHDRVMAGIGTTEDDPENPGQLRIRGGIKSFDLHQDIKSFTFLANLVRPANGSGQGGSNPFFQLNFGEGTTQQVILPFAPKQLPAPQESE